MFFVRGLALMSRFEYFEHKFGAEKYRDFLKKISTEEINFSRQPVDGAHVYPDALLAKIDQLLLDEYFDNDLNEFFELGRWDAGNFMYRYFGLYVEKQVPSDFMLQYSRLRDSLLGSGEMIIQILGKGKINMIIDYGQKIPKSICRSEQGFIQGGLEQCGARDIDLQEMRCASDSDTYICEFHIRFKHP
jgi:hypothetical protein